MKKKTSAARLSNMLGLSHARGMEAIIKAELISAVLRATEKGHFTHAELAKRSGLPRSAVTGILSGLLPPNIAKDWTWRLAFLVGMVCAPLAYAIVAGNPSRIIRYRFESALIARLLQSQWWDLPDADLKRLEPELYSTNVDAFAAAVDALRVKAK